MNTWEIITLETSPRRNYEAPRSIEIQIVVLIVISPSCNPVLSGFKSGSFKRNVENKVCDKAH